MLTVLVSTISNSQVFLLLTNEIVSFEQLGPGIFLISSEKCVVAQDLEA